MRSASLAILALLAAPAVAREPSPRKVCDQGATRTDGEARKGTGLRKLSELPPAAMVSTVFRIVDGCPSPVVVRRGIGSNPHLQLPLGNQRGRPGD